MSRNNIYTILLLLFLLSSLYEYMNLAPPPQELTTSSHSLSLLRLLPQQLQQQIIGSFAFINLIHVPQISPMFIIVPLVLQFSIQLSLSFPIKFRCLRLHNIYNNNNKLSTVVYPWLRRESELKFEIATTH